MVNKWKNAVKNVNKSFLGSMEQLERPRNVFGIKYCYFEKCFSSCYGDGDVSKWLRTLFQPDLTLIFFYLNFSGHEQLIGKF